MDHEESLSSLHFSLGYSVSLRRIGCQISMTGREDPSEEDFDWLFALLPDIVHEQDDGINTLSNKSKQPFTTTAARSCVPIAASRHGGFDERPVQPRRKDGPSMS